MADYVQMFTIIAVFILIIACINFMNLATARSERRAREVGYAKVLAPEGTNLFFSLWASHSSWPRWPLPSPY